MNKADLNLIEKIRDDLDRRASAPPNTTLVTDAEVKEYGNLAASFLAEDRAENRYVEGPLVEGQSCHHCIRRRQTDLIACRDGWPIYTEGEWEDRGSTCANFESPGSTA